MSKIEINKVAEVITKNEIDPAKARAIIEELNAIANPEPEDEPTPHEKKQFAILVSDPEGRLPKEDFVGWVLQIPESESAATTLERIHRGVYDYNASRKGRLYPAKTVGEAIENVPARFFKPEELWVKTKTPVLMLRTDNEIPNE